MDPTLNSPISLGAALYYAVCSIYTIIFQVPSFITRSRPSENAIRSRDIYVLCLRHEQSCDKLSHGRVPLPANSFSAKASSHCANLLLRVINAYAICCVHALATWHAVSYETGHHVSENVLRIARLIISCAKSCPDCSLIFMYYVLRREQEQSRPR